MRTAIGNTTIDENHNTGALLGQQQTQVEKSAEKLEKTPAVIEKEKMEKQEENSDNEKLKHNRSAKFTDLEVEHLEKIRLGIGTDKVQGP